VKGEAMDEVEKLKKMVCDGIDAMAPDLVEVSHRIHAHPELAFEEIKSAELLAASAEQAGMAVSRKAFGLPTAYAAEFGDSVKTKIGILSEYDALPGIGHACGHNVIAAIGLGAARALHGLGEDLPGFVRYLGTPAEESGCGKELMAQAGAFEGLDAAMMVHPAGINAKAVRTMCISEVLVTFRGRAAHAAVSPATGRNAADAAMISHLSIGQLRQHLTTDEQVNGVVTESGHVPNVIPGVAEARYFVRGTDAKKLKTLKEKVENCFRAGALATGCEVDVDWALADYLDMKINQTLADCYEANAVALGQTFVPYEQLPKGGTDMANVSHRVPTLHPLIEISPPTVMIHDPEFANWANSERADKAIVEGAKAMAMTAIEIMRTPSLSDSVRDEFDATADVSKTAVDLAFRSDGVRGAGGCGCGGGH
jgi:amidohydrolase